MNGIAKESDGLEYVDPILGLEGVAPLNKLNNLPFGEAVVAPSRVDVGLLSALHFFDGLLRFRRVEGGEARESRVQVVYQAKNVDLLIERVVEVLLGCPPLVVSNKRRSERKIREYDTAQPTRQRGSVELYHVHPRALDCSDICSTLAFPRSKA